MNFVNDPLVVTGLGMASSLEILFRTVIGFDGGREALWK